MNTAREKVLNSSLVRRGDTFTPTDMAKSTGETREHMANLLNHLATAGDLHLVSKGKTGQQARYAKNALSSYLLSKLWDGKLKP